MQQPADVPLCFLYVKRSVHYTTWTIFYSQQGIFTCASILHSAHQSWLSVILSDCADNVVGGGTTSAMQVPMTILSFLYPHRLTLFSASEYAGTLPILKTHQRSSLQLVSVKLHDSSVECKLSQLSDKTLHCYYWTVSGPDVATCTPQAALEELGCFGALSTRKVCTENAN